MKPARARSLKALGLLRRAALDAQAGQLVSLRGIEAQIGAARQDHMARAEDALTVTDLQVMPYMRAYLSHIGEELTRLDQENRTISREISTQAQRVTEAWRALRVVENIRDAGLRADRAAALLDEEKLQDELALIARARAETR